MALSNTYPKLVLLLDGDGMPDKAVLVKSREQALVVTRQLGQEVDFTDEHYFFDGIPIAPTMVSQGSVRLMDLTPVAEPRPLPDMPPPSTFIHGQVGNRQTA